MSPEMSLQNRIFHTPKVNTIIFLISIKMLCQIQTVIKRCIFFHVHEKIYAIQITYVDFCTFNAFLLIMSLNSKKMINLKHFYSLHMYFLSQRITFLFELINISISSLTCISDVTGTFPWARSMPDTPIVQTGF